MHNPGSHGDLVGVRSSDQRRPGQQLRSPAGRVGVPSGDQLRAGLQLRAGTRCSSLNGSQGQQYAQPWIPWPAAANVGKSIDSEPGQHDAIPCGPVLDAVPSMDPWASMMHNTGSHGDLVGVSSSDQRQAGTRCSSLDESMGQQLRTSANRSTPGRFAAAIPFGPVLDGGSQGQQLRSHAGRYSMQFPGLMRRHDAQPLIPGPAAANVGKSISAGTVGSCDPWEPSWSPIE